MKKIILIIILILSLFSNELTLNSSIITEMLLESDINQEFKNDLQYETSPYLLQHASNPIEWMPWGEKAFSKSKKQNKPIFLSIGYSTCHWCHVMAKESFTNEKIAKLFNKYFINIKVDREELPHLDIHFQELYLNNKQKSGGWPLNVFLTSDKKPFYISTYLPPYDEYYSAGLTKLLPFLASQYKDGKTKIISLNTTKSIKKIKVDDVKLSLVSLKKSLENSYDDEYAGFGKAKKFPETSKLWLMLDVAQLLKDKLLLDKYFKMLDVMALRGLYDHVDGGFYRYSVVRDWEIPHFEKMLYNQAELIPLYTKAYMLSGKKLYKNVVVESIKMLEKKFSKERLFYSASDADSEHEEGAYFTYEYEEIIETLENNKYKNNILKVFKINESGNFENKIHLNIYAKQRPKGFEEFKKNLKLIRKTKEYPFIDKKINTAWNAMTIEALFVAGVIDDKYIKLANKHLSALKNLMFDMGELYHQTIIGKKPSQKGLLEDYSFFIGALISGYEADFDEAKLDFAIYLLHDAKSKFLKNGVWYLNDDDFMVKADMKDKYYTSALGKMTQNILKLSSLKASFKYEKLAVKTLESMNLTIQEKQSDVPSSVRAYLMLKKNIITIKSNKENLIKSKPEILKIKYPYILSKKITNKKYLTCTLRSCFSIDESIIDTKRTIEKRYH